jgi:hypothetical protein
MPSSIPSHSPDSCSGGASPIAPKVFIVILNWNGISDTLECLRSLMQLTYPRWQAIVVDNGSHCDEAAVIETNFPAVTVVRNRKNLGYAAGNNVGIRHAVEHSADYIWLLNNDTVVAPDSLSELIEAGQKHMHVALLSPVIYHYEHPEEIQFAGSVLEPDWEELTTLRSVEEAEKYQRARSLTLWGTALLLKREVIDMVGHLNEQYFAYHEDLDYCLRALAAGFRTRVEPAAAVFHKSGRALGSEESPLKEYLLVRNWYLFWRSYLRGRRRRSYPARYISWVLNRALNWKRAGQAARAAHALDGAWDALHGRFGPLDSRGAMPQRLRRFLLDGLLSWHPYLWIRLLGSEPVLGEAVSRLLRRGGRRHPL